MVRRCIPSLYQRSILLPPVQAIFSKTSDPAFPDKIDKHFNHIL